MRPPLALLSRFEGVKQLKGLFITLLVMLSISSSARCGSLEHSVFAGLDARPAGLQMLDARARPSAGHANSLLAHAPGYTQEMQPQYSAAAEAGYSLLIPGLGQYRMGYKTRGKVFFGLEALTWFFIGTSLWQGYTQEQEYREYATYYAGVDGTVHGEDYWEAVGSYRSNNGPGGYNEAVRREARDLYYPDVDLINAYYEEHKITGDLSWSWQTERDYDRYNEVRHGSTQSYRRALYGVVFGLTLRLVSSIDAVRIAKSENAREKETAGDISLQFERRPGGLAVSVLKSF